MSIVSVEQPSLTRPPSDQRITLAHDVEMTGFIPRRHDPIRRHIPHGPVINIDDDDGPIAGGNSIPPRITRRPRSLISLDDSERPARRRRTTIGGRDRPVLVLDDTIEETSGSSRTNNGGQNTPIVVLDSDEEQGQPSSSRFRSRPRTIGVRRRGQRASSSSFRIFSPSPPPTQHHPVPPVPPLPPVIAGPMPFALRPPSRNNVPSHQLVPHEEHPQPEGNGGGIHLGGGLLSQGNPSGRRRGPRAQVHFQRSADETNGPVGSVPSDARLNTRLDAFSRISRLFRRITGSSSTSPSSDNAPLNHRTPPWGRRLDPHDLHTLDLLGEGPPAARFFGYTFGAPGTGGGPWVPSEALQPGPDYTKSMTHPGRAGPGWTFDFGADDEDEEANNVVKDDAGAEILVCAKCLDPLIANAEGMVDMNEEERKERRVWGLRCGHVLDGKCVDVLMKPAKTVVAENDKDEEVGGKVEGKGKGKEGPDVRDVEAEVDALLKQYDVEGKGKLIIRLPGRTPTPRIDMNDTPTDFTPPEDNSIRSRLRSRHTATAPTNPSLFSPRRSTRVVSAPSVASPPTIRRRRTRRKRGSVAEPEKIESRYFWACPVDGCSYMHESIQVGGVWKMDPEQGAVGMFV